MSLVFVPLEAIKQPRSGETICDSWWLHRPGQGVAFWANGGDYFPQCNSDKRVADIVLGRVYPEEELLFVPAAYLGHDDGKSLCRAQKSKTSGKD